MKRTEIDLLLKGSKTGVLITFAKRDKSERTMICTKNNTLMKSSGFKGFPKVTMPAGKKTQKPVSANIIRVWSTVDSAWRSIKEETIIEVTKLADDCISW